MRLIPFDYFQGKRLNSQIFYELYGCRDIGMWVGKHIYMNDDKREEKKTTFH